MDFRESIRESIESLSANKVRSALTMLGIVIGVAAVIAVFALAVGIVTFTIRIWLPVMWSFKLLGFQLPHFAQYISMFIVGVIAYRGNWFQGVTNSQGIFWLMMTIFLIVLCPLVLFFGGAVEDESIFFGGGSRQSLFYAVWEQFICVGMIVSLSVISRKAFNHQSQLAKAMSSSVYTVYIIQAPVLVFLGLALKNLNLYPPLKFALVAPLAVGLCFILANGIRKLPLAREIL